MVKKRGRGQKAKQPDQASGETPQTPQGPSEPPQRGGAPPRQEHGEIERGTRPREDTPPQISEGGATPRQGRGKVDHGPKFPQSPPAQPWGGARQERGGGDNAAKSPQSPPPQPWSGGEGGFKSRQDPPTQGTWSRGGPQQGRGRGGGRSTFHPDSPSQGSWGRGGPQQGRGRGGPQQERGRGRGGPQQGRGRGGGGPTFHHDSPSQGSWGRGRGPSEGGPKSPQDTQQQKSWGGARPRQERADTGLQEETQSLQSLSLSESQGDEKTGTLGRRIRIETNHVRLNLGTLTTVFRYDVAIEPQKKPKRMLREGMEVFRKAYYPNNFPSYDGQKLLYSATKLPLPDDTISGAVTIGTERDQQEFQIVVKLTGTLDLSPLRGLLQKKYVNQEEVFQCIEIVFRQAYVHSFVNVGRRFYTSSEADLGCGAVMYLGGFQAAVQGRAGAFMNVDVAHKAFSKTTPLINLVVDMFSSRNQPLTLQDIGNFNLFGWKKDQMSDYLRGLKVIYEVPEITKKAYRVNELSRPASEEKFEYEGRRTTVEQYFSTRWHLRLRYPRLPTVWVGSKDKRICVPMEFCTLKEGQPIEGNRVLGTQTSKMISYSATSTGERKAKIQTVMNKAGHNSNPYIKEFGFSIGTQFERLEGRVLDPPTLSYTDGLVQPAKGTWWAKKFKKGAQINKWTVVGFGVQHERFGKQIHDLAKMIQDYGRTSGMSFARPEEPFECIRNDPRSLRSCFEKRKSYDLIFVVFAPINKDSYYMVKQLAEQQFGVLTQCVKTDTLFKLNETTVRNILLKINCKMNGINHVLHQLDLITDKPCMVMGADVTHPGPQARNIPSVVAVTASHNLTATGYNLSVGIQDPKTEIIKNLERFTLEKLSRLGTEPERIYFFRDGVSDGEFEKVRESEVAAIKRACAIHCKKVKPKLTFIVVQKRHHTRFFPTDKNSCAGDKYDNVPPGTCVDTVITNPDTQNFYLLSHQSIKGVGRPTKYQVLYDDNELSYDQVEILAYYLCHLYTRCNRAVSYPAPTYFAHLAAERAKGYLYGKNVDVQNLDQNLVKIDSGFAARNPMFFS